MIPVQSPIKSYHHSPVKKFFEHPVYSVDKERRNEAVHACHVLGGIADHITNYSLLLE